MPPKRPPPRGENPGTGSRKRAARSQSVLPSNFVTELGPNDVLLGRGALATDYEGNRRLRQLVESRYEAYTHAYSRQAKTTIAKEIIDVVHSRGGRFLQSADSLTGIDSSQLPRNQAVWYVADNQSMLIAKVKQLMLDCPRKKRPSLGHAGIGGSQTMPGSHAPVAASNHSSRGSSESDSVPLGYPSLQQDGSAASSRITDPAALLMPLTTTNQSHALPSLQQLLNPSMPTLMQQQQLLNSRYTIPPSLALTQLPEMSRDGTTVPQAIGTNPVSLQALVASTLSARPPNLTQISQSSELMTALASLSNANSATANSATTTSSMVQGTLQPLQQQNSRSLTDSLAANPSSSAPNELIQGLLNIAQGSNAYAAAPTFNVDNLAANRSSAVSLDRSTVSDNNAHPNTRSTVASVTRLSNMPHPNNPLAERGPTSAIEASALQEVLLRQSLAARGVPGLLQGPGAGLSQRTLSAVTPAERQALENQLLLVQLMLALQQGDSAQGPR